MSSSESASDLTPQRPVEVIEAANRGFEALYSTSEYKKLPWHWPDLDPDFARGVAKMGLTSGRVVDIGAGAGTQALALASLGFESWATDFSSSAVALANELAAAAGVKVHGVVDDICNTRLPHTFDVVFDRGCFHVIPPLQRPHYVASVRRLVAPGGYLFLKCFSTKEAPRPGPFRFTEAQVRESFEEGFRLESMEETEFHGSRAEHPRALFAIFQRRA